MRIRPVTRLQAILTRHRDARDVLSWYGIRRPVRFADYTLAELCSAEDIDLEDLLFDLRAMDDIDDDDDFSTTFADQDDDEDDDEADEEFEAHRREEMGDDDDDDDFEDGFDDDDDEDFEDDEGYDDDVEELSA